MIATQRESEPVCKLETRTCLSGVGGGQNCANGRMDFGRKFIWWRETRLQWDGKILWVGNFDCNNSPSAQRCVAQLIWEICSPSKTINKLLKSHQKIQNGSIYCSSGDLMFSLANKAKCIVRDKNELDDRYFTRFILIWNLLSGDV